MEIQVTTKLILLILLVFAEENKINSNFFPTMINLENVLNIYLHMYSFCVIGRASFAAGIAAVRRERKKRGKMAAGRDDILEVRLSYQI